MEDKKGFTKDLSNLLRSDDRSGVTSITYELEYDPCIEVVTIKYKGGSTAKIDVTCNSLGAILKEIVREVYEDGAIGTYFRGFDTSKED